MLYWAYGSNLNMAAMTRRCPGARPVGPLVLSDSRLVFRCVADVEYAQGFSCPGGLWNISKQDEEELDAYEGVASGLYRKTYITVRFERTGKVAKALLYQMNSHGIMPPNDWYLDTIRDGYADFDLDLAPLEQALMHSWGDKSPTKRMRRKSVKRGGVLADTDHLSQGVPDEA